MNFIKMHGNGNDGIFLDAQCFSELRTLVTSPHWESTVRALCNRHTGIGADFVLVMDSCDSADIQMRIFNSDGPEAQMCSTGIRGLAKYRREYLGINEDACTVQTGAGLLKVSTRTDAKNKVITARVAMGEPILDPAKIPTTLRASQADAPVIDNPIPVDFIDFSAKWVANAKPEKTISCVSMGNPHVLIVVADASAIPLETIGPKLEHNPAFPERVNVHFVEIHSRRSLRVRSWERGAGPTLACGTGSCAVVVALTLSHRLDRVPIAVKVPGGIFEIEWLERPSPQGDPANQVILSGPIETVFEGEIDLH